MTPSQRLQLMAAVVTGTALENPWLREKKRDAPAVRPCIVCGEMKTHNNSFCSAECCQAYRERTR